MKPIKSPVTLVKPLLTVKALLRRCYATYSCLFSDPTRAASPALYWI